MTIFIFILALAVLIIVHECGHFSVAKLFKVRVDEFGLGFPPRLWGKKWGETIYSLNWLPIGGFVKIFGETIDEEATVGPAASRSLVHKPRLVQAAVLAAGVTFNLILAWALFTAGFLGGLPTSVATMDRPLLNQKMIITGVLPNSPAAKAGLQSKDEIVSLQSGADQLVAPEVDSVRKFMSTHVGQSVLISYRRSANPWSGEIVSTSQAEIVPVLGVVAGQGAIGVGLDEIGILKLSFFPAVVEGGEATLTLFWQTVKAFGGLITGLFREGQSVLGAMTGPIGLVGMVGDARSLGLAYLLGFVALISVNLAVINLAPFPALDGGRLLVLLIEAVYRRPLPAGFVNMLNMVGFALLIGLMIIVSYHDLVRLFVS